MGHGRTGVMQSGSVPHSTPAAVACGPAYLTTSATGSPSLPIERLDARLAAAVTPGRSVNHSSCAHVHSNSPAELPIGFHENMQEMHAAVLKTTDAELAKCLDELPSLMSCARAAARARNDAHAPVGP